MLEELRCLDSMEDNARTLLKEHLLTLLSCQQSYWKQRETVKWAKFGEINSKFLQAKATLKFRHNHISSLKDESGFDHHDHNAKATFLWKASKQRLGTLVQTRNLLNLNTLITARENLDFLEAPFSKIEIDNVLKNLPSNKSPGYDGFNNDFIKACWHIIVEDFCTLLEDFFHGKVNIQSINSSFITLFSRDC